MTMINSAIGLVGAVIIGSIAVKTVLPAPPPIIVNSLRYEAGQVLQDRTVTTSQSAFYAQWAATVEDAKTGASLPWCEGSGANAYPPGRKVVSFSLTDWTGNPLCTPESLPPGEYALRASWRWGTQSTAQRSPVFEVTQ